MTTFRTIVFRFLIAGMGFLTAIMPGSAQSIDAHQDYRFNAVAWMQTAAEYQVLTRQTYRLAQYQMAIGLGDGHWSADEEQVAKQDYFGKPPAVILDLDETVLDNSAFNARNVVDKTEYSQDLWNAWCLEEKARLIPGASDFIKAARALEVKVFFITNRRDDVRQATLNNLRKLGVEVSDETLLMRNDDAGRGGDKLSRRAQVAQTHRVLLLIGDNLSDICSGMEIGNNQERNELAKQKYDFLGSRWIVLPNPIYGSWERALPQTPRDALRTDRISEAVSPQK